MNENEGTRSFETVHPEPQSQPQKPKKKADLKKIITISIFAVLTAIVLLFCGIIIAEVAFKFGADVDYTDISVSSSDFKEHNNNAMMIIKDGQLLGSSAISSVKQNITNVAAYNEDLGIDEHYKYRDSSDISLLPETIDAFNSMINALYEETGCENILLDYGHLKSDRDKKDIEFPHELGATVDIKLSVNGTKKELSEDPIVFDWFTKNAHKYGFINSDPENLEHGYGLVPSVQFRYIGIVHATYIYDSKTVNTFEEYIEELKSNHNGVAKAVIIGDYLAYYVAANTDSTVKVPTNYDYTVSSDNEGGFIVTVDRSSKVK